MYKLLFLNFCCLFLLNACTPANSNNSTHQEQAAKESNPVENNANADPMSDELVLEFSGPIKRFRHIDFLTAPVTKSDETTFVKTMAPAFISQSNCECDQLATIKEMEHGYDYSMTDVGDSYLCDADNDGDQDYLVPIVCRKGDKVSITLAFINDSKDPNFFHIASNHFIEFHNDIPDCGK